jgi:hypothetical protein
VREPRHALQIRIDDEADHGNRPQPPHDRVELPDGQEEDSERSEAEERDLPRDQHSARELTLRGARVRSVDLSIDEPVQPHRERSGPDHRDGDPQEIVSRGNSVDGEQRPHVCKRKREDGVLDLDQRRKAARIASR